MTPETIELKKSFEETIIKILEDNDWGELVINVLNTYDRKEHGALVDELIDMIDSSLKDIFPFLYTKSIVKMKEGQSIEDLQLEAIAAKTMDDYFHEGRRKAIDKFVSKKFEEWKLEQHNKK